MNSGACRSLPGWLFIIRNVLHRSLKHIPNYEQRGVPFSAWLYRIAHNVVANWHRDRSRRKVIALDELVLYQQWRQSPEGLVEAGEETRELLKVVRRLPADRQQLLILKFVDGMSNEAIGQVMGRSEGAVKSLYHRTLLALRKEMAPQSQRRQKRLSRGAIMKRVGGRDDQDRN